VDGFPQVDCLKIVLILVLSHLDVLLLAVQPAQTGPRYLAIVVSRLRTHHTAAVPTALLLNDRQVFVHVLTDQIAKQQLLLQRRLHFLFSALIASGDSGEGSKLLLRVVANLLVDVEAEGEEVEQHLVRRLLRILQADLEKNWQDWLGNQKLEYLQ
jgi:hypothetical protein